MKILAKAFGVSCLVVVAFVIGRISASKSASARSGEQLQFVQAEKVRQNLAAWREVQAYLERGCGLSAKMKVDEEVEISLMFLAEHVQAYPHGVLATMLETREPKLLEEVRGQVVDWSRTFAVPECVPSEKGSEPEKGAE